MYKHFIKRLLDAIFALLGMIMLSPVFIIVSITLLLVNKGTPFFIQERPGKNQKEFNILKFKTMNDKKDSSGNLLPDEKRLTLIGRILRKTSLDELPQLINVLKGNMSFVGPRPLLNRYLPYYTKEEQLRHTVRPGITGLAQISGRNLLDWDTRLLKDVEYVKNLSLCLDLIIILKTIKKVIASEDIAIAPNLVIKDLDEVRRKN